MEITQEDDAGLICGGGVVLEVKLGSKENSLTSPCTNNPSESTIQALGVIGNISNRLKEVVDSGIKTSCEE